MIFEVTITIKPEKENNQGLIKSLVIKEIKNKMGQVKASAAELEKVRNDLQYGNVNLVFVKKSIDARHGQLKIHLRYKAYVGEQPDENVSKTDELPVWKKADGKKSAIIVGSGPAGLFGALRLLEDGIKPIIIERGKDTSSRRKDIAKISTQNQVDPNSNYCFGEGGAGTFSDGKLYTRSNKRGNINSVLQIFVHFGADEKILTDAHPHIGTDKLPKIINNMREKIVQLGGEFYFNSQVVDLITETKNGKKTATGVEVIDLSDGSHKNYQGDAVLLATGHSAPDVYMMMAKIAPESLEAKTFAVGVRVEHPRAIIDKIQYRGNQTAQMGAAEYRVTAQVQERGVYSFCMCPGGFVVPSSSSPDEIVVNGMSTAARNSKWSNAAIVVEIRPEDIPQKFVDEAKKLNCPSLAGLLFRSDLEKLTKQNGNGQAAPAQLVEDFIAGRKSEELPPTSYTAGLVSSDLNIWLPDHIKTRLAKGFTEINKNMHGFICPQALMIASETRTSTPVRISRDSESLMCTGVVNLYPCGEGAGYSGGIASSAMDGIKCCGKIAEICTNI